MPRRPKKPDPETSPQPPASEEPLEEREQPDDSLTGGESLAESAAGVEFGEPQARPANRRVARILRPVEALERLDRQWEDPTPVRTRSDTTALVLTVPEDPRGFDYLGAMGATEDEVRDACQIWLEAQLAADALALGRAIRPVVALIPAARLWFVVRLAFGSLVVFDGPGYLTPGAAVKAARVRYRALLLAEVAKDRENERQQEQQAPGPPRPTEAEDVE